jgi:UTP--glucose-1-phosphate uridylyltransferase
MTMTAGPFIRKAVIPVAGLGTRLLSATKEQPKEMLPVFALNEDRQMCLKPVVEMIFGQLIDYGVREFYFIVGRGKRAIQDHFTPDYEFVQRLDRSGRKNQALLLQKFYEKVKSSTIVWVNQPEPKGFGDAVLQAKSLVGKDPFLVHAGDTYIISATQTVCARLTEAHWKNRAAATLTLKEIQDPRQYGVAEISETDSEIVEVLRVVEKPPQPTSRFALMPVYVFSHDIFEILADTPPGRDGEIQLTDGIQELIETGHKVQAIKLRKDDVRLDIGTPETYWEALEITHRAKHTRSS